MASCSKSSFACLVECAICLERFTNPKVLPCQHTYCYSCLLNLCKGQNIVTCPQCRGKHAIPVIGVHGFGDNFTVKQLLSMLENDGSTECADCGKQRSVSTCEHCQVSVCIQCLVQHTKMASELQTLLRDVKELLESEYTRSRLNDKKHRWPEFVDSLRNERGRVERFFDDIIKKLLIRRNYLENFFRAVIRICEDFEIVAGKNSTDETLMKELSQRISDAKTIQSLNDLKGDISDYKTISRLIVGKDEQFRFVADVNSSVNVEIGEVHFGDSIVDLRGQYESDLVSAKSESLKQVVGIQGQVTVSLSESEESTSRLTVYSASGGRPKTSTAHVTTGIHHMSVETSNGRFPRNMNYERMDKGRRTVIGQGKLVKDQSKCLSYPSSCAYHAERDEIYVADYNNNRIMVYDSNSMEGRIFYLMDVNPFAVDVSSDGEHIFISGRTVLLKVALNGVMIAETRSCVEDDMISFSTLRCYDNHVVVLKEDYHCIVIYTDDLEYVRQFGVGILTYPGALTVSNMGNIYVADNGPASVHIFTWEGELVMTVMIESPDGDTEVENPGPDGDTKDENPSPDGDYFYYDLTGIAVDGDGFVCVSRCSRNRIEVYDPRWRPRTWFGEYGTSPGELDEPWELRLTPDGRLIVADSGNNRVQIFWNNS